MTFISYGQNAEDVILWRALKHINNGYYIDVGANDPEDDSITKAFYDRGWHGINIEPLAQHYACLQEQRPRDLNLKLAAGDYNGELTLFDMPSVRGWATSEPTVADHYRQQGLDVVESRVPVRRLDSLCAEFAVTDIHFLKIDVEGFETEVVRGMDFQQWRPWILIIEATRPNSQDSQYQQWEPMLLDNDYQYAYSDGLNRYYVAKEHKELATALAMQPNVFDGYKFIGYERAEQGLKRAQQQVQDLDARLQASQQQVQQVNKQLLAVMNSLSWRITKPLRQLNYRLRSSQAWQYQLSHGLVKQLFGRIKRRIKLIRHQSLLLRGKTDSTQLSPHTAAIYAKLQKAIKERTN